MTPLSEIVKSVALQNATTMERLWMLHEAGIIDEVEYRERCHDVAA